MKKILLLIIAIAILGGAYYVKRETGPTSVTPGSVVDKNFHPDPRSATFIFDESSVTLSNGESDEDSEGNPQETRILDENAYGDINADGEEDTVVLLSQSGGGSGVFIYAAAYVSGPINYKGTQALYIGDRISPESVSIASGVVTVKYLDRKEDEPFAAEPTVPTQKQFVYRNGAFVER